MVLRRLSSIDVPSVSMEPLKEKAQLTDSTTAAGSPAGAEVDIDIREVYFLIVHFLSAGPCRKTFAQFWNELMEYQLLPRRYHAWYSRSGLHSKDENDNGSSFPLSYNQLVERYPHIENNHLLKLLKQLILLTSSPAHDLVGGNMLNAADVPTLLGSGSFSLLESERKTEDKLVKLPPGYLRWPHVQADQVHGLSLREIGGGFTKHHRAPSIRAACYAVAKPTTMVQKMQNIKKLRGHRSAVYCAIFDRSGRYVITGSDDRLVKIWSKETAFCLASCRGHEGDITDLAVSSNNFLVASASNDFIIRVWRLPDGAPVSVLRGHTGAVTAIAFSPRPGCSHHLLSSSDDGTCRIWDARVSQTSLRVYVPNPSDPRVGKNNGATQCSAPNNHQILCCAYNATGTIFVTGSSDTYARVWNACKPNTDDSEKHINEMDVLSGHENDVNYVQFSGCAVVSKSSIFDNMKEDGNSKFKNSWFTHDNIVTCSRDGSAIIWIPRSRRSHGKFGRWIRAYHLKVPPPPMPPQTSRGGPRQRLLPTPRGVNMIMWSLDNRFVLAAIMDRRICVWNAGDGSLVHSLTGHSESTYVLDVHPFNPRIAMSAGYDGRTIIWDIWEGTPIRIYEIGRFKLVDGKFSPDGTSIVLSDDVGQLYTLSTGQGESQKDAKYDQFFLGDYRPLIQDTHGNVLDQETQLVPYRRNIQDLLCDSSMIPYPEPYQSMYQKRRLSALGIDYIPPTVKLAVGPADVSGFQEYPNFPLVDLDRVIEPMPEFIDAMDWEPENEIQSDDNDSEYNVGDELSSEGEHGSVKYGLFDDTECSAEETEIEDSPRDGFRRSKRKKKRADVEFMSSSGKRIKKKHLGECNGTSSCSNRTKKSRMVKAKVKKSSKLKLFRPKRTTIRNIHEFSQSSEESTDEYEDDSEIDFSDYESSVPCSQSESDTTVQNVNQKNQRRKQISLDECDNIPRSLEPSGPPINSEKRKKIILKLPIRGTSQSVWNIGNGFDKQRSSQEATIVNKHLSSQDPGSTSCGADVMLSKNGIEASDQKQSGKLEDEMSEGYKDNKIKWGEVKARTSKALRLGDSVVIDTSKPLRSENPIADDSCPDFSASFDVHNEIEYDINGIQKSESRNGIDVLFSQAISHGDELPYNNNGHLNVTTQDIDTTINKELSSACAYKSSLSTQSHEDDNEQRSGASPVHFVENPTKGQKEPGHSKFTDRQQALENNGLVTNGKTSSDKNNTEVKPMVTKLRIKSKMIGSGSESTSKLIANSARNWDSLECKLKSQLQTGGNRYSVSEASDENEATNHNTNPRSGLPEASVDGIRRTRSMGMKHDLRERSNFKETEGYESPETSKVPGKRLMISRKHSCKDWRPSAGLTVGLRSKSQKVSYSDRNLTPVDKRKPSWLMLLEHDESLRYIPQKGDNVVYLRQGHEKYIECNRPTKVNNIWGALKGKPRAVEFCKVTALAYATLPGSGESCCKIALEFVDPNSVLFKDVLKLTLPELNDLPDFLVERTLYDASIKRNWTTRDKCKVWWKNPQGEGGSWWDGRIVSVKPRSLDFPESPWERYVVRYKNDSADEIEHSPWELHDTDVPLEYPRLEEQNRAELLSLFKKLEDSGNKSRDRYGIQRLKQISQKAEFLNRFPVPLSFNVILSRLMNNYYRNLEAVENDHMLMTSNALSYLDDIEFPKKMNRLSHLLTETLSRLCELQLY